MMCARHDETFCFAQKGSGSRIITYQINPPLKWNEVTELAHWEGKGNKPFRKMTLDNIFKEERTVFKN